jgi:hypothetical protein
MKVGDGFDEGVAFGPLIEEKALAKVCASPHTLRASRGHTLPASHGLAPSHGPAPWRSPATAHHPRHAPAARSLPRRVQCNLSLSPSSLS